MAQYSIKKCIKKPANITISWKIINIKNMFSPNYGEQMKTNKIVVGSKLITNINDK